jgi:phage N-6-adenine-methyltransferase
MARTAKDVGALVRVDRGASFRGHAMVEARRSNGSLTLYDPKRGLKTIAVAEASERYWRRAIESAKAGGNDEKVVEAIEAFITSVEDRVIEQAAYVAWRDGVQEQGRPKKYRKNAKVLPASDPGHREAHRWRKRLCSKNEQGKTEPDRVKLALALEEAKQRCDRIAGFEEAGDDSKTKGGKGTGENEWYTPAEIIKLARKVLGTIDLDPATSKHAQRTVKAKHYFTKDDDGLTKQWKGRIWLNPPYAQPHIDNFAEKMLAEIAVGNATAAIMLTHNYTDTGWFHKLVMVASAVCFTRRRLKFVNPDGEPASPTQGQALFYFGPHGSKFNRVFSEVGFVLRRY